MNYYILKADLDNSFYNFEINEKVSNTKAFFDFNNFYEPNLRLENWVTLDLTLLDESEEYLEFNELDYQEPTVWSNIVQVWGTGTFVFSNKLKDCISSLFNKYGFFLDANYIDEKWYFYYCNTHLNNVLDLEYSEYDVFDDGRIMMLPNPILTKEFIRDFDVFRLSEFSSYLFVSDKAKKMLEQHFIGDVFEPVDLV